MAGLYLHIPFCKSKCAYCDFFSTPASQPVDEYVDALVGELKLRMGEIPEEGIFTIYVGGGTPTSLSLTQMTRLCGGMRSVLTDMGLLNDVSEFTVEANPDDLSEELINDYKALGINRISIGIQTFEDEMLGFLGRRHSADDARRALDVLNRSGINYSADLIFGIPGQTIDNWRRQLRELLDFRPPHFSAYLLSYEPGTRLYAKLISGKVEEASEALACEMYEALTEEASARGYEHYEISNYALAGRRAKHNSNYWNGTPYLGLGVSAHSFDGTTRRFNPIVIKEYIQSVKCGQCCFEIEEEDEANRLNDVIITALRTNDGLDLAGLYDRFSKELVDEFAKNVNKNKTLVTVGGNVRIPESDWLRADALLRDLII